MKLAVSKTPSHIPGGGFHYQLMPLKIDSEDAAKLWHLMGHEIIEVKDEVADRLIDMAKSALVHQVEIALLVENSVQNCFRKQL